MRQHGRLLAALFGLLAALVIAAPAPVTAAPAAQSAAIPPAQYCDVRITVPAQWPNGYMVNVDITNISNVPVTWSVSLVIPSPGTILQAWGVTVTNSGGNVWIRPWNPILLPGQRISFGYVASGQLVLPSVHCQPVVAEGA